MKQVIINADDFGIHESINNGILTGHRHGAISSTTIIAAGEAFDHAVQLAATAPTLGVGVHLTLVSERSVAAPEKVASLVDSEGRLPRLYPQFLKQLLQGSISLAHIRCELAAQIEKVLATGMQPTHLDSHQHMHVVPGVIDIVLDLAKQYGIKAMRIPDEPLFFFGGYRTSAGRFIGRGGLSVLASLARRKAARQGLIVPQHFYGMLAGGHMIEQNLLSIMTQLPAGTSEIMMHPGESDAAMVQHYGWHSNWQAELAAVTGKKLATQLAMPGMKLISFRELVHD